MRSIRADLETEDDPPIVRHSDDREMLSDQHEMEQLFHPENIATGAPPAPL